MADATATRPSAHADVAVTPGSATPSGERPTPTYRPDQIEPSHAYGPPSTANTAGSAVAATRSPSGSAVAVAAARAPRTARPVGARGKQSDRDRPPRDARAGAGGSARCAAGEAEQAQAAEDDRRTLGPAQARQHRVQGEQCGGQRRGRGGPHRPGEDRADQEDA